MVSSAVSRTPCRLLALSFARSPMRVRAIDRARELTAERVGKSFDRLRCAHLCLSHARRRGLLKLLQERRRAGHQRVSRKSDSQPGGAIKLADLARERPTLSGC